MVMAYSPVTDMPIAGFDFSKTTDALVVAVERAITELRNLVHFT